MHDTRLSMACVRTRMCLVAHVAQWTGISMATAGREFRKVTGYAGAPQPFVSMIGHWEGRWISCSNVGPSAIIFPVMQVCQCHIIMLMVTMLAMIHGLIWCVCMIGSCRDVELKRKWFSCSMCVP